MTKKNLHPTFTVLTDNLARIGLKDGEEVFGNSTSVPSTLTRDGVTFWRFMHDEIPAYGNDPRAEIRSKLIQIFRDDLHVDKRPEERFMEDDHGYIQWLFPLETRGVNPQAPIMKPKDHLTLSGDDNFRARMFEHFKLFSEFMGIRYCPESGTFQKVDGQQWANWISNYHNYLRITRILTSLKDFGLQQVAFDFLDFLRNEASRTMEEQNGDGVFIPYNAITRESCEDFWSKALS